MFCISAPKAHCAFGWKWTPRSAPLPDAQWDAGDCESVAPADEHGGLGDRERRRRVVGAGARLEAAAGLAQVAGRERPPPDRVVGAGDEVVRGLLEERDVRAGQIGLDQPPEERGVPIEGAGVVGRGRDGAGQRRAARRRLLAQELAGLARGMPRGRHPYKDDESHY
jgi:hypothetical protein